MDIKVGIIGGGFVGGTLFNALNTIKGYELKLFDKDPVKSKNSFEEVCECAIVFVAVPTPMIEETGECYTGIVKQVISDIRNKNLNNWIIIKSTVPPGTTEALNTQFNRIAFSPEFLTEANAMEDFITLPYQIVGLPSVWQEKEEADIIFKFFHDAYENELLDCREIFEVDATLAEMMKYTRNAYLATRLSFFQEIKLISEKLNIDFNLLKMLVGWDDRVGDHYNEIKGPWGGHCLPKDISALINTANKVGINPEVLQAVWNRNFTFPGEKDWVKMEGRAIIKKC